MGGADEQDNADRTPGEQQPGPAGNSGHGSDSLLSLLRTRRLAQFRETAFDPEADGAGDDPPKDNGEPATRARP